MVVLVTHWLSRYLLLLVLLLKIQGPLFAHGLAPCPLGPKQKESVARVAVAVTPSQTNTCGKDFMISMDEKNREPSVVFLSFDSSVASQQAKPAVLEIFAPADSRDFPSQNVTVFGFKTPVTNSVSWDSLSDILKPFKPAQNWMKTCSDNVIQEDTAVNLGTIEFPHAEVVNAFGGMMFQLDVTKAVREGIRSFALARMITCDNKDDSWDKKDVPKGNILISSLCSNHTDFYGQQYPPRIVFGSPPPPPKCTFKRGYYKIHINSRDPYSYRRKEYFLTHSLKSKEKNIDVTSSWGVHKLSKSRRLWKIREDAISDTPTTFFGVKRRSKYSYLGGTRKGKPCLGRKKDKIRIIPRELMCSQADCENVYLVSDRRKRQGKRSYLTINIENLNKKTLAWKYSWEVDRWNGLFQLIPA